MEMINLIINGHSIRAAKGLTILEAAHQNGIEIPTLCYLKNVNKGGMCRICVCQVEGARTLLPACATEITEGMVVETDSPAVRANRKMNLKLIAEKHNGDCTECERGNDCELQALCKEYGVNIERFGEYTGRGEVDRSEIHVVRDNSKCIQCRRCVSICQHLLDYSAIGVNSRGGKTRIGIDVLLKDTECIHCGMCAAYCPVGALTVKNDTFPVWKALAGKKQKVVALVSPEAAVQIGESFGEPIGKDSSGKLVSILRRIGFDYVYSTKDIEEKAIIAEREKLDQFRKEGKLPMIGCTCPSAKEYIELRYPELLEHVSDGSNIHLTAAQECRTWMCDQSAVVVLLTSCLAGKSAYRDDPRIDVVLSVPEIAAMINRACVSTFTAQQVWASLDDGCYDYTPKTSAEAFVTKYGGMCDAVADERGVAVTNLKEVDALLTDIKKGREVGDYIEIFVCPGGCYNGGGQSHQNGDKYCFLNLAEMRENGAKK